MNRRNARTGVLCCLVAAGLIASAQEDRLPSYTPLPVTLPSHARYADGQTVTIIGYNDMAGIFANLNAIFVRTHPAFHFHMQLKGTAAAPAALAFGISVFAPMGAEMSELDLQTFQSITNDELLPFRVAHCTLDPAAKSAPIGIFVNAANPLDRLTTEQVARIFTTGQPGGDFTCWGQLDLKGEWTLRSIHPTGIAEEAAGGLAAYIQTRMSGRPFAPGFDPFPQSTDVVKRVAEDKAAIGFASANIVDPRVKCLAISEENGPYLRPTPQTIAEGRYPYDRYLLIYARRARPQALDSLVKEYLRLIYSQEGQSAITSAAPHYLPLNSREAAAELAKIRTQ